MIVYKATNLVSLKVYYGITVNFYNRKASHKYLSKPENRHKRGGKTPFYDAIRKYGWNNFRWDIICDCDEVSAKELEKELISECGNNCYNLHKGGNTGFSMRTKSKKSYKNWKKKLRKARKGRKPALGMKHSESNKKLFSEVSKKYWSSQTTYEPDKILKMSFKKANLKFGISKTHYYRLKKI